MTRHPSTEGNELAPSRVDATLDVSVNGKSVSDAAQGYFLQDTEPNDPVNGTRWTDTSQNPPQTTIYDESSGTWIPNNAGDRTFVSDTEPTNLIQGDIWFNTTPADGTKVYWYNGTSLEELNFLPAIPDSVVTRSPDDDSQNSDDRKFGVKIETNVEWPKIGARVSENVSGITRAQIYRDSDGQLMGETTFSSLSAGDTFTIDLDNSLVSGETYSFVADNGGSSYTRGWYGPGGFPYDSSDGDLSIVNGSINNTGSDSSASLFDKVGNVGFN